MKNPRRSTIHALRTRRQITLHVRATGWVPNRTRTVVEARPPEYFPRRERAASRQPRAFPTPGGSPMSGCSCLPQMPRPQLPRLAGLHQPLGHLHALVARGAAPACNKGSGLTNVVEGLSAKWRQSQSGLAHHMHRGHRAGAGSAISVKPRQQRG